ncbi:hypothetical protein CONPUDRAFT_80896 [Coniophora puteana RWD-64-598 SS2]|uniref:FK506-binding protein n=1 Tax=Coniophora puteana (strain RWD-64-598) TaxID=741705 RepID=A0A5M3MV74_CONPW|nr:uncharacterized protein CONPUDRAFT_80896 [Coniophora puteana RWD-64-598 SS2]EIW82615.1 hypothetical protein CONPUDRAFT_80896 [Coniophora puteana RWD-64-598 SS2]
MPVAIAIWHVALEPGKPKTVIPQADINIKFAAFGDVLAASGASGRSSVKFTYTTPAAVDSDDEADEDEDDDEEGGMTGKPATTFLCALTPGTCETQVFDLVLERDEEYIFEVVGKNTVYLNGNYVDQVPPDQPPFDEEEEYSDEEAAFNLEDVSSDVEYAADDLEEEDEDADRFEEIADSPKQSTKKLKRAREEAMDEDEAPELVPADGAKLSKTQQKKAKKLKAEGGKAVAVEATTTTTKTETAPKDKVADKKDEKKEKKEKKDKKGKDKADEKEKDKKDKKDDAKAPESKTLPGGLIVKDYKVGTGKQAKTGSRVSMRYIGKLTNGKEFDKNVKGSPFSFKLGVGEVIKGWDQGLIGVQVGGERELTIPPALAYGKQKLPGIPPNSTLKFEVKCLSIS